MDELTAISMIRGILDQVSGVNARLRVLRYLEDGYSSPDLPEWNSGSIGATAPTSMGGINQPASAGWGAATW